MTTRPHKSKKLYGWHFVPNSRRLAYSDEPLKLGRTYRVKPPIVPCVWGLHGSTRLIDALGWAPGTILTRCEYGGKIVRKGDKFAAETRTVLWIGDVTNLLHEAACVFAEWALRRVKSPDPRSVAAIAAKRAWLRGDITTDELNAAEHAARMAAEDATTRCQRNAECNVLWSAAASAKSAAESAKSAARRAAWYAVLNTTASAAVWSDANDWLECSARELAGVDQ